MISLYLLIAGFCSAALVVLAVIVPIPGKADTRRLTGVRTALAFLWLLILATGCAFLIFRTADGGFDKLFVLMIFVCGPGGVIALTRLATGIWRLRTER